MRLWLGAFFFLLAALAAEAAVSVPPFRAKADINVPEGRESVFRGQVEIEGADFFMTADEARYNVDTQVLVATGNVTFTREVLRMISTRLQYKFSDRSFEATDIRLGAAPYYVSGPRAYGTVGAQITVEDATVTWGEPGRWKPTLRAAKIFYAPGQRLRAESVKVGIGSTVAFKLPRLEHGLGDPVLSNVALNAGYRSSLGGFVSAGLRLPVSDWMKVGGDAGFYTKRGIMIGPGADYESANAASSLAGSLESGFINDHGDKRTDVLGRPVPENRGFVTWQHREEVGSTGEFTGQLNYWKDSEILRDFRPAAFVNVQEPDTFLEASRTGVNTLLSIFARFEPNSFERVQQRLPEITFDLLPHPIGHGLVEEFHAGAAILQDSPPVGTDLKSKRIDSYYQLRRPMLPADWLSFTPVIGGRLTYYTDTAGAATPTAGTFTRTFGEAGFDAQLRASGQFEYKNPVWKIDGLRHLVTPVLSYRYFPGAGRDRSNIPAIDRNVFSTYLSQLDLAATRNIDDLRDSNVLRLGLNNVLQTRDPQYGSRDLLTFDTAIDYRLERQASERDFSDLHLEMAAMPAPWLRFDAYQSLSSRTFGLRQLNTALTVHDGSVWSAQVGNHYLANDSDEYAANGTIQLNEAYESVARLRYDARRHRLVERAVGLRQNIDNTWLVEYTATIYDGPRREGRWGVNVQIRSIGF